MTPPPMALATLGGQVGGGINDYDPISWIISLMIGAMYLLLLASSTFFMAYITVP